MPDEVSESVRVSYLMSDEERARALEQFARGVRDVEFPASQKFLMSEGVEHLERGVLGDIVLAHNAGLIDARRLPRPGSGFAYTARAYPTQLYAQPFPELGLVMGNAL